MSTLSATQQSLHSGAHSEICFCPVVSCQSEVLVNKVELLCNFFFLDIHLICWYFKLFYGLSAHIDFKKNFYKYFIKIYHRHFFLKWKLNWQKKKTYFIFWNKWMNTFRLTSRHSQKKVYKIDKKGCLTQVTNNLYL